MLTSQINIYNSNRWGLIIGYILIYHYFRDSRGEQS